MPAKIRLKRVGRKGQPSYRIVVLDGKKPRDAKVVADLGSYDPKTNPPTFEVDSETALKWLLDGAKATSAARSILSKAGVMAAWDASKRGEEIAIQPKELKPSTKRKKKEEAAAEDQQVEESIEEATADAVEEPTEEPAQETEEASEPAAEEDGAPEQDAVAEKDAADEASDSEDAEVAEPEVDAEAGSEEEPEEQADDAEEEAKEEA